MLDSAIDAGGTPKFADAREAADWVQAFLRETLRQDPRCLRLDSRHVDKGPRDKSKIHVTSLVDDCLRKAVFGLMEVPRDYDEEEDAHWGHEGWLKEEWVFAAFRASFPRQLRFQKPMSQREGSDLSGTLDAFWPAVPMVIDAKSRSVNLTAPREKDKRQVAVYAAHESLDTGKPVPGVIVHMPREDLSQVTAFPVFYDRDAVLAAAGLRESYIKDCLTNNEVPPIPDDFAADKFPCSFHVRVPGGVERKYCEYFSQCHTSMGVVVPALSTPQIQDLMKQHRELAEKATLLDKEAEAIRKGPKKELEEQMAPYLGEVGNFVQGPIEWDKDLKRISFAGRSSYDMDVAFAKDPELESRLAPYKKIGAGYYTFKYVNRVKKD